MGPMLLRRSSTAVLGLLLLAPGLAACGGEAGGIEVGDVVPAANDAQFAGQGVESVVALPVGRLEVTAGKPVTEISAADTRDVTKVQAPEGSAFVPITWQYDAATFGALAGYLSTDTGPVVDLVADGASYRIPAPELTGEGSSSFYVLVSGNGADPEMDVDFDGVTQRVDLSNGEVEEGRAAPLYDITKPRAKRFPCSPDVAFDRTTVRPPDFSCTVTRPLDLPYAGDAWAADGHTWRVVTVRTKLGRWTEVSDDLTSGAIYYADTVRGSYRLGDTEAAHVIRNPANTACPDVADNGSCTTEFQVVFDVEGKPSRALSIEQHFPLRLATVYGDAKAEDSLDVTVTTSARLK